MNSKQHLFNEAERQYLYEFKMLDEISANLHIHRNTLVKWKNKGDWDKKRKDFLKSKQSFHQELYEFARKLMKDIVSDIDAGEKIDPGRMYAFCKIIPMFTKVKDYEDIVAKKDKQDKPKGLTPDIIAQIEEQVLGIPRNKDTNNLNDTNNN